MAKIKLFKKNWHELDQIQICKNNTNGCNNEKDQFVASFVYKQQIYYVRYIESKGKYQKFNWIPLVVSNGENYLEGISQYSSQLFVDINNSNGMPQSPVVYPDYSKTDVGNGRTWPNKVFSPYVDSTAWPPYKIGDIYATTKVPFYNLGFIVSENPNLCKPSWGGYYPSEAGPLNDQIKKIRALGGDVTVSFGGAANVPLHITAPNVETLAKQYILFAEGYKLTRIDFDIEGIWIDAAYHNANIRNSQAIKKLQDDFISKGKKIMPWFTLPILPSGLTNDGIRLLQDALDAGVNIGGVNAMTMDYGDWAAPDPQGKMGKYGIQAITSLKNQLQTLYQGSKTEAQLWSMIGTTPMIGVNDVQDEVFAQSDASETLSFAQSKGLGMISMWSSNRDYPAQSHIPQTDNEFSKIFNVYNQ